MQTRDMDVDFCVTVRGDCAVTYNICRDVVEINFGRPWDGFHFAFDDTALKKLATLTNEAIGKRDKIRAGACECVTSPSALADDQEEKV